MFSTNHFIWLALCAVFIAGMLFLSIKLRFSFKTATYVVIGTSLASELSKIFTHINELTDAEGNLDGGVLGAGYLPFHLCSILIFVFFYLGITKNEKHIEALKSFLVPIAVLGGVMAMLIPTSGVNFAKPFAYQCFVYHAAIVWYALYLIITKQVSLNLRSYAKNMASLFGIMFIMLWVNSILQVYDTNFFYLVRPPMDGLPILNLKNGWFAYFVSLVLTAFLLFSLFHLPFIIKARKKTGENQ